MVSMDKPTAERRVGCTQGEHGHGNRPWILSGDLGFLKVSV